MMHLKNSEDVKIRIDRALSAKVGPEAAQIEYRVFLLDIRQSRMTLAFATCAVVAVALRSLILGIVAVIAGLVMIAFTIRRFQLRSQFFAEASKYLQYPVSWRHPVHGLPSWRKNLSDEQLQRFQQTYDKWCEDRNLTLHRQLPP
jgi:hypothetical protein